MDNTFRLIDKTIIKKNKSINYCEIIGADKYYAVVHEGKPINVKYIRVTGEPYYNKTVFTKKGYALQLAKRLNKLFNTDKFEVWEVELSKRIL